MEQKTFYSRSEGLYIALSHGELKEIAGQTVRTGEKFAEFSPVGGHGKFGHCRTSDPAVIGLLEKRAAEVGDIFDEETFKKISVPAEVRVRTTERQLEEANRLIAQLQAQVSGKKNGREAAKE